MGTEVLRPQDCLVLPGLALFPRRKPNSRPFRKPASKRRERSTKPAKTKGGAAGGRKTAAGGQDSAVFGTGRLRPDPERIPKEIKLRTAADVYAGAGFAISPSPRALPLPSFWGRTSSRTAIVLDESATRDLRRLLGLE